MRVLILTMFLALCCNISIHAQAQKNIVKSYTYDGAKKISLAVNGQVEIEEWDEKIVRLVTTIDAVNFSEATLKALTEAGRYTCETAGENGTMVLAMTKAQKEIVLKGVKIEEKYTFKIFVPRGVVVEQVKHEDVSAFFSL